MTVRKVHAENFRIGTAFELGPAGTVQHPPFWSTALTRFCDISQSPHRFVNASDLARHTL